MRNDSVTLGFNLNNLDEGNVKPILKLTLHFCMIDAYIRLHVWQTIGFH